MSNQTAQSAPTDSEEENQQEESQYDKSYEGKLANLYRDCSSQNKVAIEVFIVAAVMGVGYTKEVIDAYNILKKPLDPEKLIKDPSYKQRVERAVQLVKRHEGGRLKEEGNSKYKIEIRRTETAISQVNKVHEEQVKIKTSFSEPYAGSLKITYGLEDKEVESIIAAAKKRVKENPTLSMQDATRIEARNIIRKRVVDQAKKESGYRALGKKGKEEEVKKRLEQLDERFKSSTSTTALYENGRCDLLRRDGRNEVAQTLGVELKPQSISTQPTPVPTPPPQQPTRSIQQPVISKIPFKFSLPSLNLSKIFHPFSPSSLLGRLDSFLKLGTKTINSKILSGITRIGSKILGKVGSKAIGAAIGQALGSLLPGIGNAAAAFLSALGLDDLILRFAFQAALFAVLVVVGVFVGVVILMNNQNSLFSTNTPDNAMVIPQVAQSPQIYSWREFEKKFLSMTNHQEVRPLDTWEELTLDTDRHYQVQK